MHESWQAYDRALPRGPSRLAAGFDEIKLGRGIVILPPDAAGIVQRAERIEFCSALTSPGYVTKQFSAQEESDFRAYSHFRRIAGPLAEMLSESVAQMREPIGELLGNPWRILNTRAWMTPPNAEGRGMYQWHADGMPEVIFKAMLYFTPMDREHGGLELMEGPEFLTGPAGSWVLFWNSTLNHRGLPGTCEWRASAEITLARARKFDLTLHQPGVNAHWPEQP